MSPLQLTPGPSEVPSRGQSDSEDVSRVRVTGIHLQGLPQRVRRVRRLMMFQESAAEVIQRIGIIGPQAQGGPKPRNGLVKLVLEQQSQAVVMLRERIERIEPDGFFELGFPSRELALLEELDPQNHIAIGESSIPSPLVFFLGRLQLGRGFR